MFINVGCTRRPVWNLLRELPKTICMKNAVKSSKKRAADEGVEVHPRLKTKSVRSLMREQAIMPPSRVWNKIEAALDAQDATRKAKKIAGKKKENMKAYLEFAAVVCVIAGLIHLK